MSIILVGGEKGGTGKTTIATNLAAMRAAAGRDVLLVDSDTQGSSSIWSQVRAEGGDQARLTCVSLHGRGIAAEIRQLAERFEDIIIDAGGRDSIELRQAMLAAELMTAAREHLAGRKPAVRGMTASVSLSIHWLRAATPPAHAHVPATNAVNSTGCQPGRAAA